MRFAITLFALLGLLATVFAKNDIIACRKKNKDIEQAINYMCGWTYDMKVPSVQANQGKFSKNGKIFVQVQGTCKPAQWVPRKYCMKQFFGICASTKYGTGQRNFGRNGCQRFAIASSTRPGGW